MQTRNLVICYHQLETCSCMATFYYSLIVLSNNLSYVLIYQIHLIILSNFDDMNTAEELEGYRIKCGRPHFVATHEPLNKSLETQFFTLHLTLATV